MVQPNAQKAEVQLEAAVVFEREISAVCAVMPAGLFVSNVGRGWFHFLEGSVGQHVARDG